MMRLLLGLFHRVIDYAPAPSTFVIDDTPDKRVIVSTGNYWIT